MLEQTRSELSSAERRRRIVVLSRQGRSGLLPEDAVLLETLADVEHHVLSAAPDADAAVALLRDAEVLAATNACLPVLDAGLLARLPRLRSVVLYATGYDHIDLQLLHRRGVTLSVLPSYATPAVAEHALAMLLGLATRLHLAHDRSRGLVPPTTSLRGLELAGRTLGVVGVGRIGARVVQLGRGLGMRVVGADTSPHAVAAATRDGTPVLPLADLLGCSHAVVVCASHRHGAPPLLGADELARMPHGGLLVNVARAALVDTAAATCAVRSGALRGYAVDDQVVDRSTDGDLLAQGRVLQTGHSAWWRDETLERGRRMWGEHLVAAASGAPLDTVALPGTAPASPLPHASVVASPA